MGDTRRPRLRKSGAAALAPALLLATGFAAQVQAAPVYGDIAPILRQRCVMCHSGASPAAGLRLDSLDGILAGSARGKVVITMD